MPAAEPSTDEEPRRGDAAPRQDKAGMSWAKAYLWAAGVFAYFSIATVWIPSYVVGQTTDQSMREFVVTGLWLAGFVGGIWGLRRLQDRGHL